MKYGLSEETASKARARWGVYAGGFFGGFGGYHKILDDPVLNRVFGSELEHPDFRKAKDRWHEYKRSHGDPADVLMNPDISSFFERMYLTEEQP